jgi:hypothetical protein
MCVLVLVGGSVAVGDFCVHTVPQKSPAAIHLVYTVD